MFNWADLAKRIGAPANLYQSAADQLVSTSSSLANAIRGGQQSREEQEHKDASQSSTEYLLHNWLESAFAWLQVVVLWHEPRTSLVALAAISSSFL